jgi:hypothetical protein
MHAFRRISSTVGLALMIIGSGILLVPTSLDWSSSELPGLACWVAGALALLGGVAEWDLWSTRE